MNISATDLDSAVMVSAGRLGRPRDVYDKRAAFRLHFARRAHKAAELGDLAAARATLAAIVAEVHAAPSHLAGELYPLAMQAAAQFEALAMRRAALYAAIDQAGAA